MPTSSSAASFEKRRTFRASHSNAKSVEKSEQPSSTADNAFLTIESALPPPSNNPRKLTKRSHSTLNANSLSSSLLPFNDPIQVQADSDGIVHILRTQNEKETNPDRICLDRRGLSVFPLIDGELVSKLRLMSLQHNMITNLECLKQQQFPFLVFLDVYDNQLENLNGLNCLDNLRVLLLGKNRLKKIDGLDQLKKIEVLDLHGNQIGQIGGLSMLNELKVLNLAGNQLKIIGVGDFRGLTSLQELNLRRNKLKKLLGFGETPNLSKLFISNNDLTNIEDISSLAKSPNIKEISIDNNPVYLQGDCTHFLISYLPNLIKLNNIQVTEQLRKPSIAWRRNIEMTNSAFMNLGSDLCLNVRREEIISNARTNWELLRSQTRCLTKTKLIAKTTTTPLQVDSDLILTPLDFTKLQPHHKKGQVPNLHSKRFLMRSSSQETDNSQNTTTSSNSSNEFIRLPPILLPIIKKMEQKSDTTSSSIKLSGSLSSIGPNVDSSVSSLESDEENDEADANSESELSEMKKGEEVKAETASTSSSLTNNAPSTSSRRDNPVERTIKSAAPANLRICQKWNRTTTAKIRKQPSPSPQKDREQGGDYLIEISGRYLNIYGQCALRFIDKPWSPSKANDVNSVKFNYVNFNGIVNIMNKLKIRFRNIEHFYFKETNIHCLGQLNGLAEVQGLTSLYIDAEGNPIVEKKNWRIYAIYRLHHWGLSVINDEPVSEEEVARANQEYQSLSDLVLWSLPDALLQPLLGKLRVDTNQHGEQNVKKWLLSADPDLRSVVSKEALQWKKPSGNLAMQEEQMQRQRARTYIAHLLDELGNSINKLRLLDDKWPGILHEFVRNTLLDYGQLDIYMKGKMLEMLK